MGVIMHKGVAYGGGSNVEANPAGSATDDLSKLGIDGTVYDITDADAVHSTDIGVASGVASLDSSGKVPTAQLPTYPTVNDSTITIQKNGTTVDTFTTNQSSAKTINITMAKADVGLSNVPNVATDDQTPTVTEATTRANLASGDTLKTIIGKIKKFFSDLKDLAFVAIDGSSSTKYLRGDGTWQAFPTIPTVNNGTLTVKQNNTSKGTFTANQSGNTTVELTDTTYESKAASSGGTAVSLVTTGEKYTWNSKSDFDGAYSSLSGKPTLGTAAAKDVPSSGNASSSQVVIGNDSRLTDSRNAADVSAWAKAANKPTYTASEVGAIPLSGSSAITGSLTPNTDDSIGLGTSSKRYQNVYAKLADVTDVLTVGKQGNIGELDIIESGGYYGAIRPVTLTANRVLYQPNSNGIIATEEYIASNIGVFYTATWKATSSSANSTILTNDMVLPKGRYIIDVQSPQVSSSSAIAGLKAQTGTIVKPVENVWFYMGLYNHLLTSIEVTSTTANVTLVTGFSASVTYSYTDRAYIRAIRVG